MTLHSFLVVAMLSTAIVCGATVEPTAPAFVLTSPAGPDGGTLPTEYTCDGAGVSPAVSWSGAPEGTREFALVMTTEPRDGGTKWNWVLHGIPASVTSVPRAVVDVGQMGRGSDGPRLGYQPPCSQGPGLKRYIFTVFALSSSPRLPPRPADVTGPVLNDAIATMTLGKASLTLGYSRPR